MIPTIGVMIGLYIVTRMVEVILSSAKTRIKVMAGVTAAVNCFGILFLTFSGTNLGSPLDMASESPVLSDIETPGIDIDSLLSAGPPEPSWYLSESTNPLDDSKTVVLRLSASSGTNRMGEAPSVVLRCLRNTTEAYVNWNDYMGSDGVSVTTRVGREAAQTRRWSLSTDNTSTFYPGRSIDFIQHLMLVDTLVLQATPYNESPVTAVFVVSGLSDKIGSLQAACGWQ